MPLSDSPVDPSASVPSSMAQYRTKSGKGNTSQPISDPHTSSPAQGPFKKEKNSGFAPPFSVLAPNWGEGSPRGQERKKKEKGKEAGCGGFHLRCKCRTVSPRPSKLLPELMKCRRRRRRRTISRTNPSHTGR